MKRKTSDRKIVLWLIAALIAESLLLLWHLDIVSLGGKRGRSGHVAAGVIASSENELRRRGVDSLVWEKTEVKEDVFFYDSLLTLSQSTAKLKLEHGTEVDLSENTLVTVEPLSEDARGEIRLRFSKGSLQARNPYRPARIQAPEFAVTVNPGSEMQMRQVGEGEFEMQMGKGSAVVEGASGAPVKMDSGRMLRMNKGEARAVELDSALKWKAAPKKRVYVHGDRAVVALSWSGTASELVVQRSGSAEYVVPVSGDKADLELPAGDHRIYLRAAGGQIGAPVEVQVWKAPALHLISPLPRNRVKSEENTSFIWTRVPEASRYVLKVRGEGAGRDIASSGNSASVEFDDEGDVEWSVWGLDAQGFEIPPAYQYPLYIRHTPLAAPKLKSPVLRKPASGKKDDGRGAWLWNLILPAASAVESTELFEAVFEWETVEGARGYVIEVSETPDFRKPVVSAKTQTTQFVWSRARKREYYWRVAGSGKNGRMGVFSEPALMKPEEFKPVSVEAAAVAVAEEASAAASAVAAENIAASASAKASVSATAEDGYESSPDQPPVAAPVPRVETAAVLVPTVAEAPSFEIERKHEPHTFRVFWRAGHQAIDAKAAESVNAKLSGANTQAAAIEMDMWVRPKGWWRLGAEYASGKFSPTPEEDYPFQKDLSVTTAKVTLTRFRSHSHWGLGLTAATGPQIKRSGLETIESTNQGALGFHVQTIRQISHVEYRGEMSLLGGEHGFGLGAANRFLVKPWSGFGLLMGLELQGVYFMDGSNRTLTTEAFLQLGYQF